MHKLVAGVDEAGRGPLAGSVVAAAVILPENHKIVGLDDSKKLSEKKREFLFDQILEAAVDYSISEANVEEIDRLNILHASMLAMKRAIESLHISPDHVLVDGNRCPDIAIPATAVVGGDQLESCISAASILAKVTRDRQMRELDKRFPQYGFAKHKGYPTKQHREMLEIHGVTPSHRMSFSPVKKALPATKNSI